MEYTKEKVSKSDQYQALGGLNGGNRVEGMSVYEDQHVYLYIYCSAWWLWWWRGGRHWHIYWHIIFYLVLLFSLSLINLASVSIYLFCDSWIWRGPDGPEARRWWNPFKWVVIILSNIPSLKLLCRHIIGISEGGYHPLNNENLMIFCKGDFHPLRGSYGPGDESAGEWRPSTSAVDRPFFRFPPPRRATFVL